ncbi:hypothetical protein HUN42_00088 [Streptomyces phage Dagobah]|nr:hypothetical protein HUN42_00088 [Streptomyces phage Dagobah]
MDYSKIVASAVDGPRIGRLYLDTPSRPDAPSVRDAYASFVRQVDWQYDLMTRPVDRGGYGITVLPTDQDPYPSAEAMFQDVSGGVLSVYRTQPDQSHPILSAESNDRFRAVHDYFGHYVSGRGFDRHGEEAAWVCHSKMFTGAGQRAMTTETRGQSSALCWITSPDFPPQKALLLPEWCSTVPLEWLV